MNVKKMRAGNAHTLHAHENQGSAHNATSELMRKATIGVQRITDIQTQETHQTHAVKDKTGKSAANKGKGPEAPRLRHLCDANLATEDKRQRQLFPGYEKINDYDDFDNIYKELAVERFRHQSNQDVEFVRKLVKFRGQVHKLHAVGTQKPGEVDLDLPEE